MGTFNEVSGLIIAVLVIGAAAIFVVFLAHLSRVRATDREYARIVADVREAIDVFARSHGGTE